MMEMLRLFLGLPVPSECGREIARFQEDMKTHALRGRFSDVGNLHVTVVFLGDVEKSFLPVLGRAMHSIREKAFPISFFRCGSFRKPEGDIVFLDPDETEPLRSLHAKTVRAVRETGVTFDERPFRPHLTLGRNVRFQAGYRPQSPSVSFICKRLVLFHSHRLNGILTYTPLDFILLSG